MESLVGGLMVFGSHNWSTIIVTTNSQPWLVVLDSRNDLCYHAQ